MLEAVIERLRGMRESRPKRTKKLGSTINELFGKGLDENEIQARIDALKRRDVIVVEDGKVTYPLFKAS